MQAPMNMRLPLLVIFSVATATFAAVTAFAADAPFVTEDAAHRLDPSMQASCKDVIVTLDEGYGVVGQETRLSCGDAR